MCVCVQLEMYASPRYVTIPTDESDLCVQGRKEGSKQKKQGRHYRKEIYLV